MQPMGNKDIGKSLYGNWILLAIAYAIAFGQRVAPQSIITDLSTDLKASSVEIGILASGYFYGYLLMQIPAGILVDTLGVRRVMIASLFVSMIGTILFSVSGSLTLAFFARICVACSDAIVFVALLKFVARAFTNKHFGLMSGLSQLSGYMGGVMATLPLAYFVASWGWRPAFLCLAGVLSIMIIFFFIVEDDRSGHPQTASIGLVDEIAIGTRASLRSVVIFLGQKETWGCATCFATYFVPAMSISGVWGTRLLIEGASFSAGNAVLILSIVLLATMAGSVFGGDMADRLKKHLRRSLLACALLRTVFLLPLSPSLGTVFGMPEIALSLILFGFIGGVTLPLIFRTIKNHYGSEHIGIGVAINSTLAGIIAGSAQPLIGGAVDHAMWTRWVYVSGYDLVVVILVASSLIGVCAPYWRRRTKACNE